MPLGDIGTKVDAPTRYAGNGALPIDDNVIENAAPPILLGKKNWLFTEYERPGKRAAANQSLLATAALNEFDPAGWPRATL